MLARMEVATVCACELALPQTNFLSLLITSRLRLT